MTEGRTFGETAGLMAKGRVFGGTVRLPESPHADMHGNVRAVVRADLFAEVIVALDKYGVTLIPRDMGRTWGLSKSVVEEEVTASDYGKVFVCPLVLAYLKPEHYQRLPWVQKPDKRRERPVR